MPLIDRAIALSTRQEAFCRHYAVSGNAADAARQAGSALLERPYTSGLYFGLIGRLRHHIVAPDPIRGPSPDLATCLGGANGALSGASTPQQPAVCASPFRGGLRIAVRGDLRFREGRRWVRPEAWVPVNDRWYQPSGPAGARP